MNPYQSVFYGQLIELVENNEAFYYKDQEFGGSIYRIFNYRLASYSDFLLPGALECRGVMFEMESTAHDAEPIRLAAWPPEKFFNINENPFTMGLDLNNVVDVATKADGSLVSTFCHYGASSRYLHLKTKGSLKSEQAGAAREWLRRHPELEHRLLILTDAGYTINMEWCAPSNRIVLGYEEPHLKILNIRNASKGQYVERDQPLVTNDPILQKYWVRHHNISDPVQFVADVPLMQNREGYVVRLNTGQRVKIKTDWYFALHHMKDSINSPRRLFEAVLEETTDDMRSLFHDDALAIKMIEEMEQKVDHLYNHYVDIVERFFERNKELSRKDYAILGQKELPGLVFPLAMQKYLGREVDYMSWMKRHYKDFGIKDEVDNV